VYTKFLCKVDGDVAGKMLNYSEILAKIENKKDYTEK
jgi:hypothetical protein